MRTTEPTIIVKGERIEWRQSFSGYSAADYDLQYRFRGVGPGVDVDATASTSGSSFEAAITAVQSAILSIGSYQWQAWITEKADATNTFPVGQGFVTVERGFEAGDTGDVDLRSHAKIMLDAIDDALSAFATSDVTEYEITTPAGSRRVKRSDKAQLTKQREYWAGIVSRENTTANLRNGGRFGKPIKVSMRGR